MHGRFFYAAIFSVKTEYLRPVSHVIPVDDFTREEAELSFKFMRLDKAGYNNREPHRHNYYEVFHFIKGGGHHMLDFNLREIRDNSLHFVAPGQVHMLKRDKDAKGYVLIFSNAFFRMHGISNSLLMDYPAFNKTASPVLISANALSAELQKISSDIEKEFTGNHQFKEQILYAYLTIFLLKCRPHFIADKAYAGADKASQFLVRKFHQLIEENYQSMHKVKAYADKLSITPNHLNDISKKTTGKTALELIQERITLEAKRYLLHSDFNSKQIAFELNFNDPSYFSRFFRQQTRYSPESYRKFVRKKYHE